MRKSRTIGGFVVAAATAVALLGAPSAGAADPAHPVLYLGVAGGSKVTALDNTVTSGLTSQAALQGFQVPATAHNDLAEGSALGLLSTGAVTTDESAQPYADGAQLTSDAETAGVSLLGGLITADAVHTTSTAAFDGTTVTASTATQFVNVKITNIKIPVNIPKNFQVTVPGVARIVLNYSKIFKQGPGSIQTSGAGIYVQLLQGFGDSPLGTQVFLNPNYAAVSAHAPNSKVLLGGSAYGSRLNVTAGSLVSVDSGRTAFQALGASGTSGETLTNSTANVNIPNVLTVGAVETTIKGNRSNTTGDTYTTASVTGLDVLNGTIHADAIKAIAHTHLNADGSIKIVDSVQLVGLTIGGQRIPLTVAPNTRINVAGLGTVTLNQQFGNSFDTNVRALLIKVSTAQAGLPVGASIEVAFASGYIIS